MRIALTLAAGLLALVAVTATFGHAAPERFDPSPGQVLDAAPSRVDGWFVQDIRRQENQSFLHVYRVQADGSLGDRVDAGSTTIDDADRRHMYVGVKPSVGPGEFAVAWQTLSDEDQEADGGCHRFFVGQEAAAAAHRAKSRIDVAANCPTAAVAAPPKATASISISAPDAIDSGDVTVALKAKGVQIRLPTNEGRDPRYGHYHLYLDIPPNVTHAHDGMGGSSNPNDIMTTADSHTFKGLKPGNHVVTAVLFYDDHTPFSPAVIAGASFTVPGKDSVDGGGMSTGAAIGLAIGIGAAGLIVGGILGRALRRRAP